MILQHRQQAGRHHPDEALRKTLSLAYQRLLSHQNPDGSFAFCLYESMPSTFLTASALDVLQRLHTSYTWPVVDGFVIAKTLQWLTSQQSIDGSFRENFVFDGIYQRKIPIDFQEVALTAHVLISLSTLLAQVSSDKLFMTI
jgi:hypothetical protein